MPTTIPLTLPATFGEDAAEFLANYIGQPNADANRLNDVLSIVAAQAKSYTHGADWTGDTPTEDLPAVAFSASAQLLGNPTGLQAETMDALSVTYGAPFGWSLAERCVLDRHRLKAM